MRGRVGTATEETPYVHRPCMTTTRCRKQDADQATVFDARDSALVTHLVSEIELRSSREQLAFKIISPGSVGLNLGTSGHSQSRYIGKSAGREAFLRRAGRKSRCAACYATQSNIFFSSTLGSARHRRRAGLVRLLASVCGHEGGAA